MFQKRATMTKKNQIAGLFTLIDPAVSESESTDWIDVRKKKLVKLVLNCLMTSVERRMSKFWAASFESLGTQRKIPFNHKSKNNYLSLHKDK